MIKIYIEKDKEGNIVGYSNKGFPPDSSAELEEVTEEQLAEITASSVEQKISNFHYLVNARLVATCMQYHINDLASARGLSQTSEKNNKLYPIAKELADWGRTLVNKFIAIDEEIKAGTRSVDDIDLEAEWEAFVPKAIT